MNIAIYNRQDFAASILRPHHQVYEKMLNYINKNVYISKMVSLKWGVGEFGVCGKFLELVEGGMGKKEGTPAWDYT